MDSKFLEAVLKRRTYYALSSESPISDQQIREIIETAVKHTPSAFHSQTSRVILLMGEEHKSLWTLIRKALEEIVPPEDSPQTMEKIDSFAAAYATLLFFEEQHTIETLQGKFPSYARYFPIWSQQAAGMLQYVIWTALAEQGLGASLQHYNPLIDEKVREKWDLPESWLLVAQMPFGKPTAPPGDKEFMPVEERFFTFD